MLRIATTALALLITLVLTGCGVAEQHPIAKSDLVGSWQHEFDDGSRAVVTLNADGTAAVVGVPTVVFLPSGKAESSQIDWLDRVTSEATWSYTESRLAGFYRTSCSRCPTRSAQRYCR